MPPLEGAGIPLLGGGGMLEPLDEEEEVLQPTVTQAATATTSRGLS